MMVLITGGSASGKSEIAENLAISLGKGKRCYLATMEAPDCESKRRIDRHRKMREGKDFETLEKPYDLAGILLQAKEYQTILLECLTNLVANELFFAGKNEEEGFAAISEAVFGLQEADSLLIVVSGEVFSDGKQYDAETEKYLRLLGRLNRSFANHAEIVMEAVVGIPVIHKGKEHFPHENII